MKTVGLSEAKDRLSALVDEVDREHEIARITRHGRGAAVLMSEDDLESLHETLFWLSQPGVRDDIAEAEREDSGHLAMGSEVSKGVGGQQFDNGDDATAFVLGSRQDVLVVGDAIAEVSE